MPYESGDKYTYYYFDRQYYVYEVICIKKYLIFIRDLKG